MARTKKTAAKAFVETPVVEAPAVETAETKKTAPKKPVAPKKAAAKTSATVYVQFNGTEITADALIEKAKEISGVKSPKTVDVYVKPEESKVYFVVDGISDSFDFC